MNKNMIFFSCEIRIALPRADDAAMLAGKTPPSRNIRIDGISNMS